MRRQRWALQRRWLLALALYTLLLLLPYALHKPPPPPSGGGCPSLQAALGAWGTDGEPEPEPGSNGSSSAGGKRHIYVHATWRTGSSFVGELFNQHPDVFYLYEPAWHVWQALYPGDARSLQGALRDLLRSLFRCDFSALRPYYARGPPGANLSTAALFGWRTNKVLCSAPLCPAAARPRHHVGLVDGAACERSCPPRALRDLEAECRKYPVVAIKDVRLLELGALLPLLREPGLDVRVIQLFRDPRAVHNSRLRAQAALLRESVQVLRSQALHRQLPPPGGPGRRQRPPAEFWVSGALEVICQAWLGDVVLARRGPPALRRRYMQLRYEDLVREPRAQLRRLLAFAGLAAPPALLRFAQHMTHGTAYSSDRPFLLSARDARRAVTAWRERLSRDQVRHIEAACGDAMHFLSYPLSAGPT
ncbi:PREDICTED: carbohydrate sulfotransferase 7 [Crocodylus porosus]|uniref:Sulfotransferase n=1 Tax=Crocodylus porosus TaxID=8502 RepID=A0A7M4EJ21_CROPO|nr:PREDICTED: carbohydrate sulfotransferase 7 [Crocodylus porosus]